MGDAARLDLTMLQLDQLEAALRRRISDLAWTDGRGPQGDATEVALLACHGALTAVFEAQTALRLRSAP